MCDFIYFHLHELQYLFNIDTAYDKTSKKLVFKNLIDLVTLGRGLDWTLVELNKAISLCALTTLILSFMPFQGVDGKQLYFMSLMSLVIHSIYSIYKFYGFSVSQLWNEKKMKQFSLACYRIRDQRLDE